MVELIDFEKDEAVQELLGYASITEAYEHLISRVSQDILRQSVSDCEIESIRYLGSAGKHPGFRVGGMPIEEGSTKIKLQDMTIPFDLEITTHSGDSRHRLKATFTFECRRMDEEPQNEYLLEIHEQTDANQPGDAIGDSPMTAENIADLVASEIRSFHDSSLQERATPLLREPTKTALEWEYGDGEIFDAWLVADMGERNVWAVYCEGGHGALGYPWGIIFKDSTSFGMDSGWYQSFHDLIAEWFA